MLLLIMDLEDQINRWFVPLSCRKKTLGTAYQELQSFEMKQEDVPYIIQMVENPRFDLPGFDVFHGATDLETHDYLHILLGRGIRPKDEAFVIGFTMGSTDRVSTTEERLFSFFTKYLYPKNYRFTESDLRVFRDATKLGFISDCEPLHQIDFKAHLDCPLQELRAELRVEEDLLRAYYAIEKRRFPDSFESQRLLD